MPGTTLPADTMRPSVSISSILHTRFTSAKLDRGTSNWQDWNRSMLNTLVMSGGLDGHLDLTFACPDQSTEPITYHNWSINDRAITVFMEENAVAAEQKEMPVSKPKGAKAVYNALKVRHEQ